MPSRQQSFAIDTIFGIVAVASIPRCGQHSLGEMSKAIIQRDTLRLYSHRIAFVRDPLDRLLSTYYLYMQRHYMLDGNPVFDWKEYIDQALISSDEHVVPQNKFINSEYNIILKLESMSRFMSTIRFSKVPKLNTASREFPVDTSYRLECITEKYADDFLLYQQALSY